MVVLAGLAGGESELAADGGPGDVLVAGVGDYVRDAGVDLGAEAGQGVEFEAGVAVVHGCPEQLQAVEGLIENELGGFVADGPLW